MVSKCNDTTLFTKQVRLYNFSYNNNNRQWVFSNRKLLCTAVYSYLRLISTHIKYNQLSQLTQLEIQFCSDALKEKV